MSPLVNVYRGDYLESLHHIDFVLLGTKGVLASSGNLDERLFPRSTLKLHQAYDFVASGAYHNSQSQPQHLSLACASHNASLEQIQSLEKWLADNSLTEEDLVCGPNLPLLEPDVMAWAKTGHPLRRLHNNCSGKHTAMLLNARHLGFPLTDYHLPEHPIQKRFLDIMQKIFRIDLSNNGHALDGCGLVNYRMSLQELANAFLQLACRQDATVDVLLKAICDNPRYFAGEGRLVSDLLLATGGRILAKDGAEGMMAAVVRDRQIALAIKVKDGAFRASQTALMGLFMEFELLKQEELLLLKKWQQPTIQNSLKQTAGHLNYSK
tara:strand:+ start:6867 stop:7835 length:969 start_codon:yes stop_codon:yes gene_type:complete